MNRNVMSWAICTYGWCDVGIDQHATVSNEHYPPVCVGCVDEQTSSKKGLPSRQGNDVGRGSGDLVFTLNTRR